MSYMPTQNRGVFHPCVGWEPDFHRWNWHTPYDVHCDAAAMQLPRSPSPPAAWASSKHRGQGLAGPLAATIRLKGAAAAVSPLQGVRAHMQLGAAALRMPSMQHHPTLRWSRCSFGPRRCRPAHALDAEHSRPGQGTECLLELACSEDPEGARVNAGDSQGQKGQRCQKAQQGRGTHAQQPKWPAGCAQLDGVGTRSEAAAAGQKNVIRMTAWAALLRAC